MNHAQLTKLFKLITDGAINHAITRTTTFAESIPNGCNLDENPTHLKTYLDIQAIEGEWFLDPQVRREASAIQLEEEEP